MEQQGAHQVTETQEGQILIGKYRVDRVLGAGGMGTVFAAHHLQLDTRVAVKVLRPSLLTNPEAVACFTHEARAAIRMRNEHVTRVFDVGTLLTGAPYMVMEFLDGDDLGTLLQKHGRFSPEITVDFILQACEGIAEAHSLKIVHRDLKPSNLFCIKRPDGRPIIKVLDFGISKAMGVGSSNQPSRQTPVMAGTPSYMSPEQVEAPQSVDARTDIWALGVILFELLSGQKPFQGESVAEVSQAIATFQAQSLRCLVPELPDKLAAVIDICLSKDRHKRYSNVAQLAWALLPFGPKRGRAVVERIADILQVVAQPSQPSLSGSIETLSRLKSPERPSSERPSEVVAVPPPPTAKRIVAVAAGVALVGVLALIYSSLHRRADVRSVASPTTFAVSPEASREASREGSVTALRGGPGQAPHEQEAPVPVVAPASPAIEHAQAERTPEPEPTTRPRPFLVAPSSLVDHAVHPPGRSSSRSLPAIKPTSANQGLTNRPPPHGAPLALSRRPAPPVARAPVRIFAGSAAGLARKKVDCNPTFDLDDQGRKHFKAECMKMVPRPLAGVDETRPNCEPNFDLDDQGRKHFKAECFRGAGP